MFIPQACLTIQLTLIPVPGYLPFLLPAGATLVFIFQNSVLPEILFGLYRYPPWLNLEILRSRSTGMIMYTWLLSCGIRQTWIPVRVFTCLHPLEHGMLLWLNTIPTATLCGQSNLEDRAI